MSFFDRFRRGKPPTTDTPVEVKPREGMSDLESLGDELLEYTRQHSGELVRVIGGNAVANFYDPSAWQDGTHGQELARRYKDLEREKNVREEPEQFFTNAVEVLPDESRKKNRLEFLDWMGMNDSEMSEEVMNYLDVVLREVRQMIEGLHSLIKSLDGIKRGGLEVNAGVRNEARRLLRDVQTYREQDYDFNIFLANPRIRKILSEKGEQADLSIQKNTADLRKEYHNLSKAAQALAVLIS